MAIEQLRVGLDNFCYVVHCPETGRAAVVDPGLDASLAMRFIGAHNLDAELVINTHHHPDHSRDCRRLKETYGCDIISSVPDAARIPGGVDRTVFDGEILRIGNIRITVISTPGHTPGSICLLVNDSGLLTGDTLFIDDCGSTDMPGGSTADMFDSLQRLKSLPDGLTVYPGHDYGHAPVDTLGSQKGTNPALLARNIPELESIP